ncbi:MULTISPECIES: YkvA family protein [Prochlorococcus]|uniref:YkvA family protein n=1 Tax=Prochlorococcus TaxID=1218 RepID=UPI0005338FA6|nr:MULTISPECIES: DUF1232 domain-containing protein [Prochlorococcus]KGG12810.1 hypothetical protein EV05_0481 [Prochlorococcus sp. MIT 0601]
MSQKNNFNQEVLEAEVIDSSVIDEGAFRKVLNKAGRIIAKPAIEAFEMVLADSTPPQARVSLIAALTYLIMPIDLMPDIIPVAGFSDDLVALTAVISLWSQHMTPSIKDRARQRLDAWFPL